MLNLKHGIRSPLKRDPYERKYRARIVDLADDDADPQAVQWLAETLTTVELGDRFLAAGGTLPPRMRNFYDRAVRRVPKLCDKLGVPLHLLRPRAAKPKPPPIPNHAPDPSPREAYPGLAETPPPSPNPTGMPRYLRDADRATQQQQRRQSSSPVISREQVIQSLDEMSWEERQEELRLPRIYPRAGKPNQIPVESAYSAHERSY
jgi:hypothetical protein